MVSRSSRRGRASAQPGSSPAPALAWRLSLADACKLCDLSPNYVRELIGKDEFPPRVKAGGKVQFIAAEVRAWAEGQDWRAMVAARSQEVACG